MKTDEKAKTNQMGFYLKNINEILIKKANTMFASLDLTVAQAHVILSIFDSGEGVMTQKQLEDKLMVSHPTINGIITRLENNGFVETEIITKGRLSKNVKLTQKSISVCEHFESSKSIVDHLLCHNLTESETETFLAILKKIYEGMTNTLDNDIVYNEFIKKTEEFVSLTKKS